MLGLATTNPGAVRVVDDLLDSGTGLDLLEVEPVDGASGLTAPTGTTTVAVIRNGKRIRSSEAAATGLRANDRLIVLREPS